MTANPKDPFLLTSEQIRSLASDRVVRRGIAYFKEDRVLELQYQKDSIRASVLGSQEGQPYYTQLSIDLDGEVVVDCTCPFEWEPACKHAIATLLSYSARQPVSEQRLQGAVDRAIEQRVKRAKTDVKVKHISGDRCFGLWHAHSSQKSSSNTYTVQIRSLTERLNDCSCPDLSSNLLGTCKHIEAVLNELQNRSPKRYQKALKKGPPAPVVYLNWNESSTPEILLKRCGKASAELSALLDQHFDAQGALKTPGPEAFEAFEAEAKAFESLLIGDDARRQARTLKAQQTREQREREIKAQLESEEQALPGFSARLYPYQLDGVAFLASAGRALLADDMGLGKTIQALGAAQWLLHKESIKNVLIVCPASLKHQWKREISRFLGADTQVVNGTAPLRREQYQSKMTFTVMNYELVIKDLEPITEILSPDLLILDEAQRIRNWRTKTAAAIKQLKTRYAFVLTGTPLENRLEDLYSIMQVIDGHVLGPLWRYLLDFHITDERGRILGYRNLSELRRRLKPAMLRRDRRAVADQLPTRVEQRLDVALSPRQKTLHDAALKTAAVFADIRKRRALKAGERKQLFGALQNARMACNAAGLVDKKSQGSPKLEELRRLLEELCLEARQKVVVFSQWERMTRTIEELCRSLDLKSLRLHGGVPTAKRGPAVEAFRDDPTVKVFISTDAGGVGLNLQAASAVINLDIPWNPAVLDQRIARVHRLGQEHTVQVIHIFAADSYEERVASIMAGKRELFEQVLDPDADQDLLSLSKESAELVLDDMLNARFEELKQDYDFDAGLTQELDYSGSEDIHADLKRVAEDLGERLKRAYWTRGGLLVIVENSEPELESRLREQCHNSALVLMEARTARAFDALGEASPLSKATLLYSPDKGFGEPEQLLPPLLRAARRKQLNAQALARQGRHQEALIMNAQALLSWTAAKLGQDRPPSLAKAELWIFGEAQGSGQLELSLLYECARAAAFAKNPRMHSLDWQACLDRCQELIFEADL